METSTQVLQRRQAEVWQRIGAEPVYARGTVRLAQFKKTFAPGQQVKIRDPHTGELAPYLLRSGRPLLCSEVMPERADLALDEDGVMLTQPEFKERYERYLASFVMPEGSDPSLEPIPSVARYINAKNDPFGESRGIVEIDYDAKLEQGFKPKKFYGPDGETEEEYLAAKSDQKDMKAILAKLVELQMAQHPVNDQKDADEIVPVTDDDLEEVAQSLTPAEAANDPKKEAAPCGSFVTAGYVKQHQRHCKDVRCSPEDEAA